jgi:HK97 family phage major capsid protein
LAPASTIIAVGATVVAVLQEGELRLPLFERCAHESSQVVIEFKPIAAQVEVSAKLLESERQDVELEIRRLLLESFVAELDRVAIAGLLNNPDVPVVVGGANGAALTWDNIVALEHTVASNGGDIKSGAFLMSPNVLRALRTTQRGKGQDFIMGSDLQLLGHPVHVSQHVPRAIAFGRWADLLVVLRGPAALDVVVDTKTRAADGVLLVTAKADCGVAPLRAASFAKMTDVVTS